MARLRQNGAASGARKVPAAPHALWERAGARTGRGADALFERLDAQNAQDAQDAQREAQEAQAAAASHAAAREQAALALETLAARIRAGAWGDEIATAAAAVRAALDVTP
jgi:hypothetical protein